MDLHTLKKHTTKSKRRLGQGHGSGRGKTAGRGTKGQKARGDIPLRFEGGALALIKRLPFQRGKDRNKVFKLKPEVINLSAIADLPAKSVIDTDTLIKNGIVSERAKELGVKILGVGEIKNAYTIKVAISKSAAEKITKAGGHIESSVSQPSLS